MCTYYVSVFVIVIYSYYCCRHIYSFSVWLYVHSDCVPLSILYISDDSPNMSSYWTTARMGGRVTF